MPPAPSFLSPSVVTHALRLHSSRSAPLVLALVVLANAGSTTITVDFTATANGEGLHTLTPGDVTLRLNGRSRAVTSLQLVRLGGGPIDPLPAPFRTNLPSVTARTILFVVDARSIRPGREALLREAVREFAAALEPLDRVALALLPYDGIVLDFTTNHTKFLQQAMALTGQATRTETPSDFACRSRVTLDSLRQLLVGLSGGVGPTTIVFVSSALSGPVRDALNTRFPGQCEVLSVLYQDIADAAVAARARLYVVEPEDAPATGANRAGLEHLAGVAQGQIIPLAGAGRSGLVRLVTETSTFYLLTFEATREERNGLPHRLEIRAVRPGVTIHAHREVFIPKIAANAPVIRRIAADLLADPRPYRDIPLRGTLYLARNLEAGTVTVIPLAEVPGPASDVESAAIGLYTADGRLVAQWASRPSEEVAVPVTSKFDVPVGRYRVRIAVVSSDGRAGVLDQDLDAVLEGRGPWQVSSLLLGLTREGGFTPRLQFTDEPVAIGMVEIYGPTSSSAMVSFELARSPEGPAIVSVPGTFTRTPDGSRVISTGALPIGGFLPGRWLVRAVITANGLPPLRVSRTLDKVAR